MEERFRKLPKEKQDKIINSALSIFGKYEYKKATTDEIIKSAAISKGLLFHYFGSKKKLYLDLYAYCIDYCVEKIVDNIDPDETDFFVILKLSTYNKLRILQQHPAIFQFLLRVYHETAPEVTPEINLGTAKATNEIVSQVFKQADYSKFKDDFTLEMIINTITWSANGFITQKNEMGYYDPDEIREDFELYIEMYRKAFYKEEYV